MRDTNTFGWRMKWERERLGIGQKELAEMMQKQFNITIGQSGISKIENDEVKTPPFPVQIALSKILHCSLDYLITGEEWKDAADRFITDEANQVGALLDEMDEDARQFVMTIVQRIHQFNMERKARQEDMRVLMEEYIALLPQPNQAKAAKAQLILRKVDSLWR